MLSFSCIVILGFIGTPGRDALTVLPEVPEGPCRVLKIDCEKCRCGKQTCTVIEKCNICRFARAPTKRIAEAGFCSTQTKREVVKQCCEAKCENGATATSVPSIPPVLINSMSPFKMKFFLGIENRHQSVHRRLPLLLSYVPVRFGV